jgi:hypothetical protein
MFTPKTDFFTLAVVCFAPEEVKRPLLAPYWLYPL